MSKHAKQSKDVTRRSGKRGERIAQGKSVSKSDLQEIEELIERHAAQAKSLSSRTWAAMSDSPELKQAWERMVRAAAPRTGVELGELLAWTVHETYLQDIDDLRRRVEELEMTRSKIDDHRAVMASIEALIKDEGIASIDQTFNIDGETVTATNRQELRAVVQKFDQSIDGLKKDKRARTKELRRRIQESARLAESIVENSKHIRKTVMKSLKG